MVMVEYTVLFINYNVGELINFIILTYVNGY